MNCANIDPGNVFSFAHATKQTHLVRTIDHQEKNSRVSSTVSKIKLKQKCQQPNI